MSDNVDKRTATQRIEDLENVLRVVYQGLAETQNEVIKMQADNKNLLRLQNDIVLLKEYCKILNKKIDAVVQLSKPETGVSTEAVKDLVTKMNMDELKAQIEDSISRGLLTPSNPGDVVTEESYLACDELNDDDTVFNPRVQFGMDSQPAENKERLLGKKVGDVINMGENRFRVRILELYNIVKAKPVEESADASAPTVENAPVVTAEAPASDPLPELPAETPVAQFVASDFAAPTQQTASGS